MVAAFTFGQSASFPNLCVATDTSTSVTGTITQRRIYVSNAYGEYLTGDSSVDYTAWPLADSSISLDILTEDIGASVRVDWLDVSNAIVETLTQQFPLSEYNMQFFYLLIESQGLTPGIIQDSNYFSNSLLLFTDIIAGVEAVERYDDIAACQNCFNRATALRLNQAMAF
jgi:hypothetical protein